MIDRYIPRLRKSGRAVAAVLLLAITGSAASAEPIDPQADRILQAMSTHLAGLGTFTVKADIDEEVLTHDGQKLQLSSTATLAMQRPNRLRAQREGLLSNLRFVFDGTQLRVHAVNENLYLQLDQGGTVDDAIRRVEFETGLTAPGADLLFSDPYAVLTRGVESAAYIGTTSVQGVECHHLAFREDQVDWQLWVSTGDAPLPVKYVITTKWMTGAPQYSLRLYEWFENPPLADSDFPATAPKGARRISGMSLNELGEVTILEEGK